ncbi:MAG TPA: hypothetical protein VJ044_13560 [Candidatus Hodarchaeales archaeon]|nr:hypothetical protein [Candidatus Hodarchaeales archaeon]
MDRFVVKISDLEGGYVTVLDEYTDQVTDWIYYNIDATPYRGTVRRLRFEIQPAGLVDSRVRIDSVKIEPFEAVLPVEISSFNASTQNNNVRLNWTTQLETDNYGNISFSAFDFPGICPVESGLRTKCLLGAP